jgi:hypothetical protein
MTAKFVVTKKAVNKVIDGDGPLCSHMSVDPEGQYGKGINLVIGARYGDRCACRFNKEGVKELIDILTDIHEAMEEETW